MDEEFEEITYKYDTQLLVEGKNLSDDKVREYITNNIEGDCLLVVGDEELLKLHFHTDIPWKVIEYCATLGDVYDVVVENMVRQAAGLQG
ncbi:MAG: kinase to dihydroxyacetone kinase [Clostridia bacterium]|nr:kinase to dihydroxyacetone kinase [Clostridia bacterium]MBQ8792433.1 kinase to dihydroxyacetone kinase [Clostridia bacterium]